MTEHLTIPQSASKAMLYKTIAPQIESLISDEPNIIANLANTTAILREAFNWFWIGFYLTDGEDELVLGPFQGTLACTRIKKGRGVCGTAWSRGQTIVVDDVELFDGHIACSSASRSEIVIPILCNGKFRGVLDIDSDQLSTFDDTDRQGLELICETIAKMIARCEK